LKVVYSIPDHIEDSLISRAAGNGHQAIRVGNSSMFESFPDADLFIDGLFSGFFFNTDKPLLFHAPAPVWKFLPSAPPNSARICVWPGFWERDLWEYVPKPGSAVNWALLMQQIGIQAKPVPDIPGMIAPRILATIINEAIYTLHAGIASRKDIDTAMRLGTNYPLGPIEWGSAIGGIEIHRVLKSMEESDKRYAPHVDLIQQLQ
jgi:3-hydroxybutyryl-CoA dehydrogenase